MHFTSKIFLKLLISFCFIIIFYNHLSIKKIYAKTCDFNTFCPDGYKTVNGCIAGKIGQVTDNKSTYGCKECDDSKRYDVQSLLYNFEDRKFYSNTTSERYEHNKCKDRISGPYSTKARPDIDVSSCLPNPAEQRINYFQTTYHDNNGSAFFRNSDICFKNLQGNVECYQNAVNNSFDLHTCTMIMVTITYDENATGITRTSHSAGFTGCPAQRYIDNRCKKCKRDGQYICGDWEECDWGEEGTRVEHAYFTVPASYKLYTVNNNFYTKRCKDDIWEIVDIEFESEVITLPVTIYSDVPRNCDSWVYDSDYNYTFTLKAGSSENGRDINKIKLDIGGNIFTINISGTNASLENTIVGDLEASIMECQGGSTVCFLPTEILVNLDISKLDELNGNILIKALAESISGVNSEWFEAGSFNAGKKPSIIFDYVPIGGSDIRFNWNFSDTSISPTSCGITCSHPIDESCSSPNPVNCTGDPVGTYTAMGSVSGQGSYNFEFSASNICGTTTTHNIVEIANPWLATVFGDSYVYRGYSGMKMQNITGVFDGVPQGQAYFSTYIISKSNTSSAYPDPDSLKKYLLSKYEDNNVNLFPIKNAKIYEYIKDLAVENNCFNLNNCEVVTNSHTPPCNSTKIYFANNLTFDNDYNSNADSACAFVVEGDVDIGPDVNRLDGFFILDGTFITNSYNPDNQTLVVNGGVVSSYTAFGRKFYVFDNSTNPSEIIIYDPKYIDLLRDLIGVGYPSKIRELGYSDPTE